MVLDFVLIAQNEGIEMSLSRKGIYGIDEREMLQSFEAAITQEKLQQGHPASISNAQIILGLEPAKLAGAMASCDVTDVDWYADPHFCLVSTEVDRIRDSSASGRGSGRDFADSFKDARTRGPEAMIQVISHHIMKSFSNISLRRVEEFHFDSRSIGSYGLDSMIGAELRNWLFKELGIDIGFPDSAGA